MSNLIVIADDDEDVVSEMEANLRAVGYTTRVAANGQEALDLALELQPDLVILDVVMPILDGFQTCKAIRENPQTSAISVILLTAQAIGADKIRGLKLGADDYIVKPIDWEEFTARVASVLRRAEHLRDLSPLTNLPGSYRISSELSKLVADPKNKFAVMNIEIDNFKSINDRYGSNRGDKVIKFLGKTLSEIMARYSEKPSVLGHVGGSQFVIVTAPDNVDTMCEQIITRFDEGIVGFYDEQAQHAGYIELTNRKDEQIQHKICKIAIGVVSSKFRDIRSSWEATAVAAEMCAHAKRNEGSSYEIDRRKTDDQFLAMLDS